MTIAALLNHFGVGNLRYVTVAGEVVFDGVTRVPGGGYAHATHGAVTPVERHTFHGGDEEPDDGYGVDRAWWDNEDEINAHIDAMKTAFPAFTYVPATEDLPPCWIGNINTGRGTFCVAIILRSDRGLPRVRLAKGPRLGKNAGRSWQPSPHLYVNGNLCVADQGDWNADVHTAATVTAWTAHWLAAYTLWRITGRWPTEGVTAVAA